MKIVLFCGGLGLRIRDAENIPKPMVLIGYRPIIWHLMMYYSSFGYKDFILCLGYQPHIIKNYFLNYNDYITEDFTILRGGKEIVLLNGSAQDWNITFVDTGLNLNIGQRLKAVEKYLQNDEIFMANYSDVLSDLYLPEYVDYFLNSDKVASFITVKPSNSFHIVSVEDGHHVSDIINVNSSGIRINGGFFIFKRDIFKYIEDGEELVLEPFQRLIQKKELIAYQHEGFWASMDTFKEKQQLEELFHREMAPWQIWRNSVK
jgi:glucose-1-phosphate cytidylyltransferase